MSSWFLSLSLAILPRCASELLLPSLISMGLTVNAVSLINMFRHLLHIALIAIDCQQNRVKSIGVVVPTCVSRF